MNAPTVCYYCRSHLTPTASIPAGIGGGEGCLSRLESKKKYQPVKYPTTPLCLRASGGTAPGSKRSGSMAVPRGPRLRREGRRRGAGRRTRTRTVSGWAGGGKE
eukprot:766628-Hanusia_phi.AAC.4